MYLYNMHIYMYTCCVMYMYNLHECMHIFVSMYTCCVNTNLAVSKDLHYYERLQLYVHVHVASFPVSTP